MKNKFNPDYKTTVQEYVKELIEVRNIKDYKKFFSNIYTTKKLTKTQIKRLKKIFDISEDIFINLNR